MGCNIENAIKVKIAFKKKKKKKTEDMLEVAKMFELALNMKKDRS